MDLELHKPLVKDPRDVDGLLFKSNGLVIAPIFVLCVLAACLATYSQSAELSRAFQALGVTA